MVCGPCSNKKLLLPGQGNGKAVRVCLQCYDTASKVKASSPTAVDSLNNKDQQRNSADSSGGDSSGDDEEGNKEEKHDEVIELNIKVISLITFLNYIFLFCCSLNFTPHLPDEVDYNYIILNNTANRNIIENNIFKNY